MLLKVAFNVLSLRDKCGQISVVYPSIEMDGYKYAVPTGRCICLVFSCCFNCLHLKMEIEWVSIFSPSKDGGNGHMRGKKRDPSV
jgi:hypothetical protein